ncbi:MAG: nuclear transport factor 2 family protein [Pseudomonadota bacterium]
MSSDLALIKQTLAAYCHRVDRGTAAEVAALFAEDAVLKPHYDGNYDVEGREAIQGWYAFYHEHLRAGVKHLKHLIHSIELDVTGDSATGTTYLTATMINKEDDTAYQANGTYYDKLLRHDDRWLFKERLIIVEYMTPLPSYVAEFPAMGFPGAN